MYEPFTMSSGRFLWSISQRAALAAVGRYASSGDEGSGERWCHAAAGVPACRCMLV